MYDTGLNLYLLAQRLLLYVCPKDEPLLIFLILTMQVSIGFFQITLRFNLYISNVKCRISNP